MNASDAVRIAMVDALADRVDAATGSPSSGTFRLYNTASPPQLLVTIPLNATAFNAATDTGTRIEALLNTSTSLVSNTYSGSTDNIGAYRIYDGDGVLLIEGAITVSGGEYNVGSLQILNGYTYELVSGRLYMLDQL